MKKELLLFLTSNYQKDRVRQDTIQNKYNLFDEVKLLNENNLDEYIKPIVNNIIDVYGMRGYGYWVWKPYLILQELNELDEDDILVFLDIHCILDNIKNKFNYLINELKNQPIIIGRMGCNDLAYTTTKLKEHIELSLNYKFTEDQLREIQYEGGLVFIRNCDEAKKFIKQWFDIMLNGIEYVSDSYNEDPENNKEFITNKHDQSVVSLLYKYHSYKTPAWLNWDFMNAKTKFDKIYVLSLITNHSRQFFIKQQFDDLGIDFEFIYGTDFYNIKTDARNNEIKYPNVWPTGWCDDKNEFSRDYGCSLSHYNAVLFAYELGYDNVLIIEDDICFIKDKQLIFNCLTNIPDDADYVTYDPRFSRIEDRDKFVKLLDSDNLFIDVTNKIDYLISGAMMYAIMNRKTMETYLNNQREYFTISDQVKEFNINNKTVQKYVCSKCICTDQINIESDFMHNSKSDCIIYECTYDILEKYNKDMFYQPGAFELYTKY